MEAPLPVEVRERALRIGPRYQGRADRHCPVGQPGWIAEGGIHAFGQQAVEAHGRSVGDGLAAGSPLLASAAVDHCRVDAGEADVWLVASGALGDSPAAAASAADSLRLAVAASADHRGRPSAVIATQGNPAEHAANFADP